MSFNIRRATEQDIEELTALADILHSELEISTCLPFDQDSMGETFRKLITSQNGVVLILEYQGEIVGAVGGVITFQFWNYHVPVAQQTGIFVLPWFRGRQSLELQRSFEAECAARGAKGLYMMTPRLLTRVWASLDYRELETVFFKEL